MKIKVKTMFLICVLFVTLFFLVSCERPTPRAEAGNEVASFVYDTTIIDTNGLCSSEAVILANNLILSDEAIANVHDKDTVFSCNVNDDWLVINAEDKLNWVSVWDGTTLMYNQPVINVDEAVTYCGSYTHVCVNPTFGVSWDIETSKDRVEIIRSP